jgi:hypothetical protein
MRESTGSVLGPLLWNIGFDWALRGVLVPDAKIVCYADDTLVLVRAADFLTAIRLATTYTTLMVRRIESLGLQVALEKTGAIFFSQASAESPPGRVSAHRERSSGHRRKHALPGFSPRLHMELSGTFSPPVPQTCKHCSLAEPAPTKCWRP